MKCEKEHKNHKCIYFGDIIPEDNNITNSSIKLKKNIEDLSKDIKLIFESLNNILTNLNIYYNKFNDAVTSYNNNRNYQMIKNINEYINKNNIINKDLENIITDDNISMKLKNLMLLYFKINNKNSQNKINLKVDENINIVKNEISEEKIYTKTYRYDYSKKNENSKIIDNNLFPTVIIDTGTTMIRAGFSDSDSEEPLVRLPTCIG